MSHCVPKTCYKTCNLITTIIVYHSSQRNMGKQFQIVITLLFLLFVSGVVEGGKNCRYKKRTRCYPKEKCEPRACAIYCSRYEDFECDGGCICLSDCGPHNSTTTTTTTTTTTSSSTHPPPPLPIFSFRRCMV
ncbi:hypothetical protein ACP275_11G019500 [Erythranthe tilingii]